MAAKGTSNADRDWWEGVWEWAAALEEATGGGVVVMLKREARKGSWTVTLRLCHVVDGRAAGIIVQRRSTWPNASRATLAPHILNETIKLDAMVEQEAEEILKQS